MRIGVLGSTRGSSLLPFVNALQNQNNHFDKQFNAENAHQIAVVMSNKADALILERAKEINIPAIFLSSQGLSREAYDALITQQLLHYRIECVVLIGYMRILSGAFIKQWSERIINVHPSLLPAFAGLMDLAVHEAVLASRVQETGVTVHHVTEEVDNGPIIIQKKCAVLASDTPDILKMRVQALEGEALAEAIEIIEDKL